MCDKTIIATKYYYCDNDNDILILAGNFQGTEFSMTHNYPAGIAFA